MNAPTQPAMHTAARIARALREPRQTVHRALADMLESGQVIVNGGLVKAWTVAALPAELRARLETEARRFGARDTEALLSQPAGRWEPPTPLDQVAQAHIDKAVKLREAMALALARLDNGGATEAELCGLGSAEYSRVFGYGISARHFRRLLKRVAERDAGAGEWGRVDLYLPETAFRAAPADRVDAQRECLHRELDETVKQLDNKTSPTLEDRAYLFDQAFQHYESLAGDLGESPTDERERRRLKGSLLAYLRRAVPALSDSPGALRRMFERKLRTWRDADRALQALQDQRPLQSGNFKGRPFVEDEKKIRNMAIRLDGNEALAHRVLREQGALSEEFCAAHPYDPRRDKGALPGNVRAAITPEVDMCLPLRRGPWQARMRGPYIPRDWSGVKPGDWFTADDVTWNHYFKEQLPDGRWEILRGECLLMTDLRSGYPLDFLLVPGHYNGEHIRSLILRVHDAVGLPRRGFYFERGVWKSRLIAGDGRNGAAVHWRETENGLRGLGIGVDLRHATTPRAKPIEGIFHILQDRMRRIPGFVGFNERDYDAERIQKLIARARRQDGQALAAFPSKREWAESIRATLSEFSHDPQNGKMLEGAAPAEAWAAELRERPLRQLAQEARYILATHQKRLTVKPEGIVIEIRRKRLLYYNEHTGPRVGKEVWAFYNIEMPDLLTVCDLDRQAYFSVRRVELPAMDATPAQFEEVNRLRKAHMAPARAIFGELQHEVTSTITRDSEHTVQDRALGRFHNEAMDQARAERARGERGLRRLRVAAAAAGVPLPAQVRNVEEAADALTKREIYRRRLEAQELQAGREGSL